MAIRSVIGNVVEQQLYAAPMHVCQQYVEVCQRAEDRIGSVVEVPVVGRVLKSSLSGVSSAVMLPSFVRACVG